MTKKVIKSEMLEALNTTNIKALSLLQKQAISKMLFEIALSRGETDEYLANILQDFVNISKLNQQEFSASCSLSLFFALKVIRSIQNEFKYKVLADIVFNCCASNLSNNSLDYIYTITGIPEVDVN